MAAYSEANENAPLLPKAAPTAEKEATSQQLISVALSVFALLFFVSCNTSIMCVKIVQLTNFDLLT